MHLLTGWPGRMLAAVNIADPEELSVIDTVPVLNWLLPFDVCALNADQVAPLATRPITSAAAVVTRPLVRPPDPAARWRPGLFDVMVMAVRSAAVGPTRGLGADQRNRTRRATTEYRPAGHSGHPERDQLQGGDGGALTELAVAVVPPAPHRVVQLHRTGLQIAGAHLAPGDLRADLGRKPLAADH